MQPELPRIGKISADVFDHVIYPRLGRQRPEVLVGPRHGVDIGIVDIGGGQVMALTTDPVFIVPPYGWERSAWFAVHILCSDAVTSGLPLAYMTIDLNLPRSITGEEFARMWQTMHDACERLGVAIVTGHTGRYEGCDYPMVGGATVIAIGARDAYITPEMARPGDLVLVTKGPAIEAAGLFAATFPARLAERFGEPFARDAQEIFWQMSVVEEARIAAAVGVRDNGVTAMHDATECGIWGGLSEIASASRVGMRIEKERIPVQEPVVKICELFGIDPFVSISEGTLLLTSRPHKAAEVERRIREAGIPVGIVGEVLPEDKGCWISEGGRSVPLVHPRVDPFWEAFGRAAAASPEGA